MRAGPLCGHAALRAITPRTDLAGATRAARSRGLQRQQECSRQTARQAQSAKLDQVNGPLRVCSLAFGVGLRLRCAPSLPLTCREYFQLSEKLDPRAFTVLIANSNTERRRWYRLHKRVIEMSLYTKCHVLFVDDETGRTLGTFSSDELQHFTAQASAVLPIIVSVLRMLCRCPNPSISEPISGHTSATNRRRWGVSAICDVLVLPGTQLEEASTLF